ncbi:MAG TPA: M1 family peptidase, partial [Candidatus Binatia bacterium]|nr:M1 family peptidase [Candidatus Binatia bacterium]
MARRLAVLASLAVCFSLISGVTQAASPTVFSPGAPGAGDPYYPLDGNGGYDVGHYLLDVRYDPDTDFLTGVATITAMATQNLSRFNLDLEGLSVESITVNGRAATWSRDGGELTVTPSRGIRNGTRFVTIVEYSGVPETLTEFGVSGFIHTDDG